MALTNTQAIDYVLYTANNNHGLVPWLDQTAERNTLNANLRNILGIGA